MGLPGDQPRMGQAWDVILEQLKELSSATVQQNIQLTSRVAQLEEELQVWKQARSVTIESAERDKKQYESDKLKLTKRISEFEEFQDSLVLCVIDGDVNIFTDELLSAGQEGGREAAKLLARGISVYLSSMDIQAQGRFGFCLSIYFNRKGLQNTLVLNNVCTVEQFESFLAGFSQASPRFNLIDVGNGKEAADAKVKEYLRTYIRFPQTIKIFLGGGHDNEYVPILTAFKNDSLLEKLVLLKGYQEVAMELNALRLPMLSLEDVFRTKKLPSHRKSKSGRTPKVTYADDDLMNQFARSTSTFSNSSSNGHDVEHSPRKIRFVESIKPLHKYNPLPCTEYYLLNRCPRKKYCRYGHDYNLSPEEMEALAGAAKKLPCGAARRGIECLFGDICIWGHVCPYGLSCSYIESGKCWFRNPGAHGKSRPALTT